MGLHAIEMGPEDGDLVALVHGTMDRAGGMARAARLVAARHRVLIYDRRGYGRSKPHPGPFDLGAQVDDLLELLAGRPCVVVGHSYGGNVTLAAAIRAPELVHAVAVYETPMPWLPWWPSHTSGSRAANADDPARAAEYFLRRMVGDETWERLPARTRAERRAEGVALVGELGAINAAVPYDPTRVSVPAVVARGEHGASHHRAGTDVLAAAIPRAELVVVEGAAHGVHTTKPAAFAALAERAVSLARASDPAV